MVAVGDLPLEPTGSPAPLGADPPFTGGLMPKLKRLIGCIAISTVMVQSALFAADGASSATELPIVCAERNTPSITNESPVKKNMFKPLEVPESFIAPDDWQVEGAIIGSRDDIHALSQNDVVFVNIGSDDAITQGTRCIIYRKGDYTGGAGIVIKALGELEIIGGVREKSATARIVYAHDVIRVGDILEIE